MSDKKKKDEKSPFAGALADKLKGLDIEPSKKKQQAKKQAEGEPADEQDRAERSRRGEQSPQDEQPELSDEELFRRAVENVDRETIERAHQPPPPQELSRKRRAEHRRFSPDEKTSGGTGGADQTRGAGEDSLDRGQDEAPQKPLSERELFEKALEDLDAGDVYSGKFFGKGPELPPEEEVEPRSDRPGAAGSQSADTDESSREEPVSEDQAREDVAERREMRKFEKAVGPVKRMDRRRKYRKPTRPDPEEHARQVTAYRSDSPEEMITPPLPKSGDGLNNVGPLDAAQKEMLDRYKKRSRRHEVPEINVRGDTVDDALRQIELFVHQSWKEKAQFVRIIHGRGLQSDGDPVLKPAVLRWLEGPGFRYVKGYVPEVNPAGDYGSVIAELEKKD